MCQLVETIKCNNGKLENIVYHNKRLNSSRLELFGPSNIIDLQKCIRIPSKVKTGVYKCRVLYTNKIEKIEFTEHKPLSINTLKIVVDNTIDYHLKFTDRYRLAQLFRKRESCDDIIIVKNEFVTDSYSANLVFWDEVKWVTPTTYLLPGTQRAKLLDEGAIFQQSIKTSQLASFEKVGLINVMNGLSNMPIVSTRNIFPSNL